MNMFSYSLSPEASACSLAHMAHSIFPIAFTCQPPCEALKLTRERLTDLLFSTRKKWGVCARACACACAQTERRGIREPHPPFSRHFPNVCRWTVARRDFLTGPTYPTGKLKKLTISSLSNRWEVGKHKYKKKLHCGQIQEGSPVDNSFKGFSEHIFSACWDISFWTFQLLKSSICLF